MIALAAPAPDAHADFAAGVAAFRDGDYGTAYKEWRPLADKGNAAAQHNLGALYNHGLGVDEDLVEAARWYSRAARRGNANAQTKMGVFLAQGLGRVAQDYTQAAAWFREAAEQQHPEAQYNLGVLYATGTGVEQDRVQALMWLNLAQEAGVAQAAKARQSLIEDMPPEEVEEAALLAEIMKPMDSSAGATGETFIPNPEETPAAVPSGDSAPPPDVPAIVVRLASYVSQQAAVDGWVQLRQVHGDLLGRLNYGIAVIDLGEQGNFYRLLAGPFDNQAMARALCAELKARNIYCATSF